MIPGKYDLTLYLHATFPGVQFQCLDIEDNPVNLTGCAAWAKVRRGSASGEELLDLAPAITNAAQGIVTVPEIPHGDLSDLPPGTHAWDLLIEDETGSRRGPYLTGKFVIARTVTHD